jgi:CRP-like cAMP-binding protein
LLLSFTNTLLANSDFFKDVKSATAIALANRGEIRTYQAGEVVTEAGDTCRELLLLIAGEAQIESPNESRIDRLVPGQILDELEVLSHVEQTGTIVANASPTRILAVPVDALDDLLEHDGDFARRVLEMESRRLQQLLHPNAFPQTKN